VEASREQIRELLGQGLSSDAVASRLGISRGTVAAVRAHMTMGTYERTRLSRSSGIYLRRDGELLPLTERPYETEDVLQALLAEHPGLLAGEDVGDSPRRWVLLSREVSIGDEEGASGRWSLDHLFVDQDAIPTLVEVKRSSDTRIRREVVGQLIEYAANGPRYWPVEQLRTLYETGCQARGVDPEAELRECVGEAADIEEWWRQVEANLRLGRLRLVFVADEISRELRRIIEFLNEQMTETEVLGVEIRQYVDSAEEYQTLVPRLIGQTETARDVKRTTSGRPRNRWGEAEVVKMICEAHPGPIGDRMVRLYEFMRDHGARPSWGTGSKPSATMWLGETDDERSNPVSISFYEDGVAINFDFVRERRAPEQMQRLADLMRTIPGVAGYIQGLEQQSWGMHRAMKPRDVLTDDDALEAWKAALLQASAPA
jgi:hypothetical protein